MSISYYKKPTSFNITYTAPHTKFAPSELAKDENKNKLIFNDSTGNISFYDGGLLLDIETYPDIASFPVSGEANKFYLDQSENKMYRWANSQYYYFPYDVYSKGESDANYYNKTNLYTKTESDGKYTIRSNTNNDMTGSQINNLDTLTVANSFNANQTAVSFSKPVNCGWQNLSFVTQINDKIKLDETNTKLLTSLNLNGNDLLNVETIGVDNANVTNANLGATSITGNLNMNSNNINGVNSLSATTANLGTTTLSGVLNMGNNHLFGVNELTATSANFGSTSLSGNLNMNANNINNVNSLGATSATLGATSLSGALNMNTNNITNVNALTAVSANLGATTLSGNLALGSNSISGVNNISASTANLGATALTGNLTLGSNSISGVNDISATTLSGTLKTDSIRLGDNTDMISFATSTTGNGGTHEINVKGRTRFNMTTADDQCAIYTYLPFNELHIVGYGTSPNRAVRIYDNVFANLSFTTPTANITTSNVTTGNITTATIGTSNVTTGNITTATIGTANITTENTTTANIGTANVTTGNVSALNVTSSSGINGKIRFDGLNIDVMDNMYFGTDKSLYDVNRIDCAEIETPNGTVLPTNHIPLATKTTWMAGSGNILYEYTAPTNYEIYSAQFTAGTTVIPTSFMGGNTASAYYDDALGYGAMITGRFIIRYAL